MSFVLLHNIALAAGAGISIQYVSEEEVSSLESAFSSASAQWMSFIDAIVPEAVGVDVPAIPDPTDIDVYTGGGWEGLLLQLGLSSDRLGVFGGWDAIGSVYVCFNLGAS